MLLSSHFLKKIKVPVSLKCWDLGFLEPTIYWKHAHEPDQSKWLLVHGVLSKYESRR